MPVLRRAIIAGALASLLALGFVGLLFLDVELPTELHAFKLATLRKLKTVSGSTSTEEDAEFHILPIGEPSTEFDDEIEDTVFGTVPPPLAPPPVSPLADTNAGFSHELGMADQGVDDSVDPTEESDYGSPDFVYPGSSSHPTTNLQLASSFETTVPNGAIINGYSVFDNLVVHNGTFYIVTHNRSAFPEKKEDIIWRPYVSGQVEREPHEEDVQFITPDELVPLLGDSAIRMEGFSWINYDVPQFMSHYYHWWGEIILGGWRVYSRVGLDEDGSFHPERLELPKRFLLPIVSDGKWRDKARVVGPLMRAAFPQTAIEERDQWLDFIRLNSTVVFDRALVTNRRSAHRHRWGGRWGKMAAGTQELEAASYNPISPSPEHEGFWSPLRKSLTLNLLGYIPTFESLTNRTVISPPSDKSDKPVVTYIDRQGTGRRLIDESHKSMVDALRALEEEGICEAQIVRMENFGLREQVRLITRSAIIVGVHGNGLTHQLWMPPSERSTVIEIVYPNSYDFDYEMLARNMGHKHYIVWNDTLITYKKGTYHEGVQIPKEFHSAKIYVHGPAVAQKIKERLLGIEGDDAEKSDE